MITFDVPGDHVDYTNRITNEGNGGIVSSNLQKPLEFLQLAYEYKKEFKST